MNYNLKESVIKIIIFIAVAIYLTIKSTFWLTTTIFCFCWISGIIYLGFLVAEWVDNLIMNWRNKW